MRGVCSADFFFDMKDGVPLRDRIGIEFNTNLEAIEHSHVLAQHFRDDSLTDDQDLEISVVNALGREIHRKFVHRDQPDAETSNSAPAGKVDRLG
jgi:hypothetical protein